MRAHGHVQRQLGEAVAAAASLQKADEELVRCASSGRLAGTPRSRTTRPTASARPRARQRTGAIEGEEMSERELAVLRLLPTELSQREIGQTLFVSLNTVKTHTRHIFTKLGATNREEAVAAARRVGLL
jgi:LuxR family maltose regulon positive regulatory protein